MHPRTDKKATMPCYYMGSSVSGQDDLNRALWLATRAGKMKRPLGTTRCIPQAKLPRKPYNKSFIDQVCSVKMAGYWPRSFFASLWTSTSSFRLRLDWDQRSCSWTGLVITVVKLLDTTCTSSLDMFNSAEFREFKLTRDNAQFRDCCCVMSH